MIETEGRKPTIRLSLKGRARLLCTGAVLMLLSLHTAGVVRGQPDGQATGQGESGEPARPAAVGESAANNALADEITAELETSVSKGLASLARLQRSDGSFGGERYGSNAGITSIAALAFMADGHVPGRGEYGETVERALEFVLGSASETGMFAADTSHGPMYGHGFATLFLGEVIGMMPGGPDTPLARRAHEAMVKACRLIVQTQNDEGGWRYNPVPHDADISVTICQIMALRSARNAGIAVPGVDIKATIDKAVVYVRLCQNPDGGFRYQSSRGSSAWPRSAAGVASLYYAGIYEDNAIDRGLEYLIRTAHPTRGRGAGAHYFYGHYYAVQSMYLAGGTYWADWWPAIRGQLLERQREDGSWADPSAGTAYGTAMALIILQMPKRYLPIFQK